NWNFSDNKELEIKDFTGIFPDNYSREKLLGEIASEVYNSLEKCLNKDSLRVIIEQNIPNVPNRFSAISQGCDFFIKNILQLEGDKLVFNSQPLFQLALGLKIYYSLENQTPPLNSEGESLWREYSFAAAIARRKRRIQYVLSKFEGYILEITKSVKNPETFSSSATLAIIISETGSSELAKFFIKYLSELSFRPIRYSKNRNLISSFAFAHCFVLAGNEGFDWFYKEYLDPMYPLDWSDGEVAASVLSHWILISNFSITAEQKVKFSKLISAIKSINLKLCEHSCAEVCLFPVLAIVSPEKFAFSDLVSLYAKNLLSTILKDKAKKLLSSIYITNKPAVLDALNRVATEDEDREANVATFWLELSKEAPSIKILHSAISCLDKYPYMRSELETRFGAANFQSVLYWYTFYGKYKGKLTANSAISLYKKGEHNMFLLGRGLSEGFGYYRVEEVEKTLQSLLQNKGDEALYWLFDILSEDNDSYHFFFYAEYWNVILQKLMDSENLHLALFRQCIKFLDSYTLPRNSEVRYKIKELAIKKPQYKKTLQESLNSLSKKLRINSARMLFSCFPGENTLVVEIVINSVTNYIHDTHGGHEWLRFALRLSLGESLISHIVTKIETFSSTSKTFALTLLLHNKYTLNNDLYKQLIVGLLGEGRIIGQNWGYI
ncbi:MAG: hypothetical protein FD167_3645, partial [bacterium]